jgi:hypothetical protein
MEDDTRIFFQDEPSNRIVLMTSRYAYRSFWETGLKDERDWEKAARARQKINRELDAGGYTDSFVAVLPSKNTTTVLPLSDVSQIIKSAA